MLSPVWPICGSAFLLVGAGAALWRRRPFGWVGRDEIAAPRPALAAPVADPVRPDRLWPLDELLDLLPHPVVALSQGGGLVHANRTARACFGDTLPALLRHPLLGEAVRSLREQDDADVELALDVPVRRVMRAALRVEPQAGGAGMILLSLTDRTEQEAILRMRTDFIANASHELRTPLASLIGFIETLQGPAADDAPARIRFLTIMAGQAARMRRLIDNLLSLSRIQMHEHERPGGQVRLDRLLARVADEHEPQLREAGARLVLDVAGSLPPVAGDADQLAQVLHNLLENALKYGIRPGAAGRIALSARRAGQERDPSAGGVVLSVADDGPGIAPQHVPRLTERFYRVEEGGPARSGSGLGLAIVKHIVGRHGGRLMIESQPGAGACFSVWLPDAPPERAIRLPAPGR